MTGEQRFQQMIIDAICGVGFPSITLADQCQRVGLADFTGNQWNPDWAWDRKALWKIKIEDLQALYDGLCEQRDINQQPTAPLEASPEIIIAH